MKAFRYKKLIIGSIISISAIVIIFATVLSGEMTGYIMIPAIICLIVGAFGTTEALTEYVERHNDVSDNLIYRKKLVKYQVSWLTLYILQILSFIVVVVTLVLHFIFGSYDNLCFALVSVLGVFVTLSYLIENLIISYIKRKNNITN